MDGWKMNYEVMFYIEPKHHYSLYLRFTDHQSKIKQNHIISKALKSRSLVLVTDLPLLINSCPKRSNASILISRHSVSTLSVLSSSLQTRLSSCIYFVCVHSQGGLAEHIIYIINWCFPKYILWNTSHII